MSWIKKLPFASALALIAIIYVWIGSWWSEIYSRLILLFGLDKINLNLLDPNLDHTEANFYMNVFNALYLTVAVLLGIFFYMTLKSNRSNKQIWLRIFISIVLAFIINVLIQFFIVQSSYPELPPG